MQFILAVRVPVSVKEAEVSLNSFVNPCHTGNWSTLAYTSLVIITTFVRAFKHMPAGVTAEVMACTEAP